MRERSREKGRERVSEGEKKLEGTKSSNLWKNKRAQAGSLKQKIGDKGDSLCKQEQRRLVCGNGRGPALFEAALHELLE